MSTSDPSFNDFSGPADFPIGVWVPPAEDLGKWKGRGCNCVFEVPDGHDPVQWSSEAQLNGLWQIRAPFAAPTDVAGLAKDAQTPGLMAWAHHDEPDAAKIDPATLIANYKAMKTAAPNMPVAINFSGGYVIGLQQGTPSTVYQQYIQAADWLGNDIYPVTGWNQPNNLQIVTQTVDVMRQWSSKFKFVFIECGNQNLSWVPNDRSATPAEMVVEIWLAVVHGVRGIMYFPEQIGGGFQFDVTPPENVAAMSIANWQITRWSSYFARGSYQFLDTGNTNVHAATWTTPAGTLKIAVNWTSQQQSALGAVFGPLEVKFLENLAQGQPDVEPTSYDSKQDSRLTAVEAVARGNWNALRRINAQLQNVIVPALKKSKIIP